MKENYEGKNKKQRIWEIDAVRGLLILLVLINHLDITFNAFCINGYYQIDSTKLANIVDPLGFWFSYNNEVVIRSASWILTIRDYLTYPIVDIFFVVSGISCMFSRNHLNRSLKLLLGAFIISGFTKILEIWTGDPTQYIQFGVLHCYAYCHIIYAFALQKCRNKTLLGITVAVFIVGYYLRWNPVVIESSLLYPFGIYERGLMARDYWPILPMLGWMLLGVLIGRRFYSEKMSLISNEKVTKITRPLQWLGRWSGQLYIAHIFLYTIVFCGIGYFFDLF